MEFFSRNGLSIFSGASETVNHETKFNHEVTDFKKILLMESQKISDAFELSKSNNASEISDSNDNF